MSTINNSNGYIYSTPRTLACCVYRAKIISQMFPRKTAKTIYWYAHERALRICELEDGNWARTLQLLNGAVPFLSLDELIDFSSDRWPEIAHPLILAHEVHEL